MKKAFLVPLFIILSLIGVGAGYFTLIHFVIGDLGDVRVNLVNVTVSRVELDHAVITVTIELVNPAKREVKIDVMSVSLYAGSYYIGDVKRRTLRSGLMARYLLSSIFLFTTLLLIQS